jgi:hypothetical protein
MYEMNPNDTNISLEELEEMVAKKRGEKRRRQQLIEELQVLEREMPPIRENPSCSSSLVKSADTNDGNIRSRCYPLFLSLI